MTAAQLRAILQQHPDETPILIPGYESAWDPLERTERIFVCARPDMLLPHGMLPMSEPIERPDYEGAFERCGRDTPGAFAALALGVARRDSPRSAHPPEIGQ